jgi:hypothetical protein
MFLFAITLVELYNELQAAGCGVRVTNHHGVTSLISLIAYVDDLAILAGSPDQLQAALNIVEKCARRLRARLNIGTTKTAIMVWGSGRLSEADSHRTFSLSGKSVPRVTMYKYLGVRIGCRGGWLHHFQFMAEKVITKTREIAFWAKSNIVPLPVAVRVWDLYVKRAVLYGAAVCTPPPAAVSLLNNAQRQAGRIVLGLRRLAPGPAVLSELGWIPISTELVRERASLLGSISRCGN